MLYYRTTNTASLKQKRTELKEKQQSQQFLFLGSKTNSNILKSYDRHQRKNKQMFFFCFIYKVPNYYSTSKCNYFGTPSSKFTCKISIKI